MRLSGMGPHARTDLAPVTARPGRQVGNPPSQDKNEGTENPRAEKQRPYQQQPPVRVRIQRTTQRELPLLTTRAVKRPEVLRMRGALFRVNFDSNKPLT